MKVLFVLACVFLALLMLSLIRIGGEVRYNEAGLTAKLKVFIFKFTVYPMKKSEKPPKPPKKKKEKKNPEPTPQEHTVGGSLAMLKEFLPLISETAGRLKRKIRVDRITFHLTWGDSDPAACAMGYGASNAVLGILWPILEQNFNIKAREIHTEIDFNQTAPTVFLHAVLTLTVGQCVALGIRLGSRAFSVYRKNHKQNTKEAYHYERANEPSPR